MKFEEFYYDIEKEIYDLEVLVKIYNENRATYKESYYGHIYCPECYEAKLAFKPTAKTPYLSTLPTAIHNKDCSCNYDSASKQQMQEYYTDTKNVDAINRKLKSCIDLLLKPSKKTGKTGLGKNDKGTKIESTFGFETKGKKFLIRRKKITLPFDETEDYGVPMLFYGCVKLKWIKKEYSGQVSKYLQVLKPENNWILASIYVSDKVYQYLDETVKNITDEKYHIAFMSEMKKKGTFNNCSLLFSSHIIIDKNT